MPTREGTPKKKRGAQDFVWMLAILGVIFAVILGRQEYKIYQINKEAEATRLRVEQLQRVQADLEAERKAAGGGEAKAEDQEQSDDE